LCSAVQAGLEALGAPEMPADEIQQALDRNLVGAAQVNGHVG
jgi:hypothetical protein